MRKTKLAICVAAFLCSVSCATLLACDKEGYKSETATPVAQATVYNVGTSVDLFELFETGNGYFYTFKVGKEGEELKEVGGRYYYATASGKYVVECVGYKDDIKRTGKTTFTVSDTLPYMVMNGAVVSVNYNSKVKLENIIRNADPFYSSDTDVQFKVDWVDYYASPYVTESERYDLSVEGAGDNFFDGERVHFNKEGIYQFHLIIENAGGTSDGMFEVRCKERLGTYKELGGVNYDPENWTVSWSPVEGASFYRVKVDYENVITDQTDLDILQYFVEGEDAIRKFDLAVIPLDADKKELKYEDGEGYEVNGMLVEWDLIIAPEQFGSIVLSEKSKVDVATGVATVEGGKPSGLGRNDLGAMKNEYIAWQGEYGLNTYVEFEFTGNNLPNVCFFADEINDCITYGGKSSDEEKNKGLLVLSGMYGAYSGNTYYLAGGDTIATFGPYRFQSGWSAPNYRWCTLDKTIATTPAYLSTGPNGWDPSPYTLLTQQGLRNDRSGNAYKYIVGTYGEEIAGKTKIMLSIKLLNAETGALIYRIAHDTTLTTEDFAGSGEFKGGNIIAYAPSKEEETLSQFKVSKPYYAEPDPTVTRGETYNEDGSVTLKGIYTSNANAGTFNDKSVKNNIGYYGLRGSYGVGTYVDISFTGNNMPYVSLFSDTIDGNLSNRGDGKKGMVIVNGIVSKATEDYQNYNDRLNVFGPNKISGISNDVMLAYYQPKAPSVPALASFTQSALQEGIPYRYIVGTSLGADNTITLEMYLYNLKDGTQVGEAIVPTKATATDLPAGNIVLYSCMKGQNADKTAPLDTTFTFNGVSSERNLPTNMKKVNGATFNEDGSITLKGQTVANGNNGSLRGINNSYVAWEGSYGAGTYLEFEFKGNNMPQLCFFADRINGNMVCNADATATDQKGMLVLNAIVTDGANGFDGTTGLRVWGTNRYDLWARSVFANVTAFAPSALSDEITYRMVIGTVIAEEYVYLDVALFNQATNAVIYKGALKTQKKATDYAADGNPTGHIIAYAGLKGGEDTTFTFNKIGKKTDFDTVGATA